MKAILATNLDGVIGCKDGIPWKCKMDMRFFKNYTVGLKVVMGRVTMETLGGPLPDRENYVLSKTLPAGKHNGFIVVNCPSQLPEDIESMVVIGGAKIYDMFKRDIKEMYVSTIVSDAEGEELVHVNVDELTQGMIAVQSFEKGSRTYSKLGKELKLKPQEVEDSNLLRITCYRKYR